MADDVAIPRDQQVSITQVLNGQNGPLPPGHSPAPLLSQPVGRMQVQPELLIPAEKKAAELAALLDQVSKAVLPGAPAGTPGFRTGFQIGELNVGWHQMFLTLSVAVQAAEAKIRATREAYRATEQANTQALAAK